MTGDARLRHRPTRHPEWFGLSDMRAHQTNRGPFLVGQWTISYMISRLLHGVANLHDWLLVWARRTGGIRIFFLFFGGQILTEALFPTIAGKLFLVIIFGVLPVMILVLMAKDMTRDRRKESLFGWHVPSEREIADSALLLLCPTGGTLMGLVAGNAILDWVR